MAPQITAAQSVLPPRPKGRGARLGRVRDPCVLPLFICHGAFSGPPQGKVLLPKVSCLPDHRACAPCFGNPSIKARRVIKRKLSFSTPTPPPPSVEKNVAKRYQFPAGTASARASLKKLCRVGESPGPRGLRRSQRRCTGPLYIGTKSAVKEGPSWPITL